MVSVRDCIALHEVLQNVLEEKEPIQLLQQELWTHEEDYRGRLINANVNLVDPLGYPYSALTRVAMARSTPTQRRVLHLLLAHGGNPNLPVPYPAGAHVAFSGEIGAFKECLGAGLVVNYRVLEAACRGLGTLQLRQLAIRAYQVNPTVQSGSSEHDQ